MAKSKSSENSHSEWVAETIRRREALGWTPYLLSKKAGISPRTVPNFERAYHKPTPSTRRLIDQALAQGERARR